MSTSAVCFRRLPPAFRRRTSCCVGSAGSHQPSAAFRRRRGCVEDEALAGAPRMLPPVRGSGRKI
eukprot:9477435-Pyramimonas_sp.AAC.1